MKVVMTNILVKKFDELLSETGVLPKGSHLLVAVSGGADSVALLRLLSNVAGKHSFELVVAHLDHGLRQESANDAQFVKELANEMHLACVTGRAEVALAENGMRGGVEEIARKIRRDFLTQKAIEHKCNFIVLGHHRDDQAETFLLNLLRGAGPTGLSGMRLCNPPYVRPLLAFSHEQLQRYLVSEHILWREDKSNRDPRFTRNRIRHELLPLLETFNPRIREHLAQLCQKLAGDEDCWRQLIERELYSISRKDNGAIALPCALLTKLPSAFSARLLRAALEQVRGHLRKITAAHIQAIQALLVSERPQSEVMLPGAWVGRRYESLIVAKAAPKSRPWTPVHITDSGAYLLPDGRTLNVEFGVASQGESQNSVEIPLENVPASMIIRTFRTGDWIVPAGMRGRRKLQDVFVDLKFTREQRLSSPLLVSSDEVLWIVGVRKSAHLRSLKCESGKVVRLKVAST